MGPLVPFIISNEFNLIIALLAGIGFGFALEQAGFSSTKKLVGLFYGYDFTVLKVFFTGGVTAMIGILLFNHWGILDLSMIYVNPTFLYSALVGGAIMGVGFIIGGFCPGTSVCAVATGKLDALAFIGGLVIGVVFYTLSYETLWMDLRNSGLIGKVKIGELLGVSEGVAVLIFISFGLFTFWMVEKIRKVFKIKDVEY